MNLTLDDMREILGIYGEVPAAPAGYEFTGAFRKPTEDDWWVIEAGTAAACGAWCYRRLILRKLWEPELYCTVSTKDIYPLGYKIPEGYESLGFGLRHPEATYYLSSGSTGHVYPIHVYPIEWKDFADARILLKKKA